MVGVDQDHAPAFCPGKLLGCFQQLASHSLPLEFRQDVQRKLREVEVVGQGQGDVHRAHNVALHPGHQDDLAFVGIGKFQELLKRRVGEIVTPPRLHPYLPANFDGGQEIGAIGPVEGIGNPELFDPYVFNHRGRHSSRFCHSPSKPAGLKPSE
ncbi:hypothetical protein D9M72_488270 [compost metagenome]